MLRVLAEALLCGFPIVFVFLSLYQISSWKIGMFRWGIVVLEFSETFPTVIPEHLKNRIIEYKGVTFKFVSQKFGLFQSTIIGRRPVPNDYSRTPSGFPVLGEIILHESGFAKVILRIPHSIILLLLSVWIALFGFTALSKDIKIDLSGIFMETSMLFIFVVFLFLVEKAQLKYGVQKIKEYILENT
jgi:hypothetical protein